MDKLQTKLSTLVYFIFPLILIFLVFGLPFMRSGLIVGSDWAFPYTQEQMIESGKESWHLWSYRQLPNGTQIPHHNIYLFNMLIGISGFIGMDGVTFQRLFILFVMTFIYFGFYLSFKKIIKNDFATMMGGLVYLFSPIVFNYFIMGWVFVLLFMALAPIFIRLSWTYWHTGQIKYLLVSGLLLIISFWQSQSIIWVPLLFFITWCLSISEVSFRKLFLRGIMSILIVGVIMIIGHGSWIYAINTAKESYLVDSTSTSDVHRFGLVATLSNQIRGWGSLFNEHFELSYLRPIQFLSFLPLVLLFYNLANKWTSKYKKIVLLSLILVLLSPTIYLNRQYIATLPLSNIIRDVSRFIIFTQLGLALSIALFYSSIKNRWLTLLITFLLMLNMHPYWLGRIHTPQSIITGNSQFSKDQRIRFLDVNIQNNEEIMSSNDLSRRSVILPSGSFLTSINNPEFFSTFTELADIDAYFSPYTTGFFLSDKSNPQVYEYSKEYLSSAGYDVEKLFQMSRLYSIDTIYFRKNLITTFPVDFYSPTFQQTCQPTNLANSDWDITHVCPIDRVYPIIYLIKQTDLNNLNNLNATIACNQEVTSDCIDNSNISLIDSSHSEFLFRLSQSSPESSILVANTTFHPGWTIVDTSNNKLNFEHIRVNNVSNGWIVPPNYQGELRIYFQPDAIFKKLATYSLFVLSLLTIYTIYQFYPRRTTE